MTDDREEAPAEIVARLQSNWDRYRGRHAEILMRSINSTTASDAFYWSGIERDLAVYALARVLADAGDGQ